ncbi:hypothetical protein BsWGS_05896 [Bradybaena similaris]
MEGFLNHALHEVNRQHQALVNECRLLRDLLKPWPRKKTLIEEVENTEIKLTPEPQVPSESLSYAEQQVDELLQKAEKARRLKSKVNKGVDDALRLEMCIIKNIDVKDVDISTSQSSSSCLVNYSALDNKDVDIKNNKCQTVPSSVPSQQTEMLSKQASEIQLLQPAKNVPQKNVITTKNSSANMEKSKESKCETLRPHSHKSSSSRTRHIPAHMLAPFKTNTIRLPKHKNSHLSEYSSSTRHAAKISLSVGTKALKPLPEIATRASKRVTRSSDTSECSVAHNSDPKSGCVKELSSISLFNNNTNLIEESGPMHYPDSHISTADTKPSGSSSSNLKATVDRTAEYSNICTQSMGRGQSLQNVADAQTRLQENELQQFTLQKNGSSLKLPNKLIRLVNTNNSLREKLSTATSTNRPSTAHPAQQFVERLCSEDDISPELRTRVSALTCLRSHQMLTDTLQSLNMGQLSESSSTEVLYRAKKILEFVLTVFAELQEETNYLSQVKYRHLAPVPDISLQCVNQKATSWLDTGQKRDFQYGCWEHLQSSKLWSHLKFTEKYLQLNISLVKAALAEWWEVLLENGDLSIFQGVYGLLTSHGQFLPTLIENPA